MAVPQAELLRRFVHNPSYHWKKRRVDKRKNRLEIEYPIARSEGHTIARINHEEGKLYLLDRNPAWGTPRISRSISRQLNTLAREAQAAGFEVLLCASRWALVTGAVCGRELRPLPPSKTPRAKAKTGSSGVRLGCRRGKPTPTIYADFDPEAGF